MTRRSRRRHHPIVWMLALLPVVMFLEVALWLVFHALALLLIAAAVLACNHWQLHRRAARWLTGAPGTGRPPAVVQGQVVTETEDLRRQVAKLEGDAARHEQVVDDLEDAAGRPIGAVTATYRHLQQQYGTAATGKPGRRP
jgi:hypothetical protein